MRRFNTQPPQLKTEPRKRLRQVMFEQFEAPGMFESKTCPFGNHIVATGRTDPRHHIVEIIPMTDPDPDGKH